MEKKVLQVRLPVDLHARLVDAKGSRSFNAEIVARLEDTFAKSDVEYVSTVVSPSLANTVVSSVAEVSAKVAGLPVPAPPTVFERAGRRTMICAHRRRPDEFCPRCD